MNEYTKKLKIHGPSDGKGPYDDGGDYALIDADGKIVGEAIHIVDHNEYRPAQANAQLWATAPDLLAACEFGPPDNYGPALLEVAADIAESTGQLETARGLRQKAKMEHAAITKARGENE
jgi:hypothetical protein